MATDPTSLPTVADIQQAKLDMLDVKTFNQSNSNEFIDNTGHSKLTMTGVINDAETRVTEAVSNTGYYVAFTFTAGGTVTTSNQLVRDTINGKLYKWGGSLPHIITPLSTPVPQAENAWRYVADNHNSLTDRDTENSHPASAIQSGDGRSVEQRLNALPSEVSAHVTAEADRAEAAADAAELSSGVYESTASGIASTSLGAYFSVPSAESKEYLILYKHDTGSVATEIKRYPSSKAVDDALTEVNSKITEIQTPTSSIAFAISDEDGNIPFFIDNEGKTTNESKNIKVSEEDSLSGFVWAVTDKGGETPLGIKESGEVSIAGQDFESLDLLDYDLAIVDDQGNIALGIKKSGEVDGIVQSEISGESFSLGSDDVIVHIGDSYTEGAYNLKDKHYMGQLSNLSPYRHVSFGVSGNEAIDQANRIIRLSTFTGETFKEIGAKYAFITTLTNDGIFRTSDLDYYAENVRRLVDTVLGEGVEPIITTEFPATSTEHALLRQIASEYGIGFIDCTSINTELNGLDVGPFHQGHPGIRTNGVFWLPMLDYIKKNLPKPSKAVKIFRKRAGYSISSISDLLYKDRFDLLKRFREISTYHRHINPWYMYDSLSPINYSFVTQQDEYLKIQKGEAVSFDDYALIKLTVPVTAVTGEYVNVKLDLTNSPQIYVRDYLNQADAIDGKSDGATATDPSYLSNYDKPRGSWRLVNLVNGVIKLDKNALRNSMSGNDIDILIVGATSVSGLNVDYSGVERVADTRISDAKLIGSNLLAQPYCGNSTQLADWSVTGSPTTIIPIDASMSPRKIDGSTLDGVCIVSATNKIAQSITLPSDNGTVKKYKITVWCRYFPKAFLDPAVYTGLDPNQVINRITNPNDSEVTEDTFDLRLLNAEVWFGANKPSNGGVNYKDFAPLNWRPVEFLIEALPYQNGNTLSLELSCIDGEIQIAKILLNEVI